MSSFFSNNNSKLVLLKHCTYSDCFLTRLITMYCHMNNYTGWAKKLCTKLMAGILSNQINQTFRS